MSTKPNRFRLSEIASRLLILAPLVGCFLATDSAAGDRVGRAQECRLVVGGKEFISGDCPAIIHERGGITVGNNGVGGEMMPFWAYVNSEDGSNGTAFFNGDAGSKYALVDLGSVEQREGCWFAPDAEICVRNFTELDMGLDSDAVTKDTEHLIFASSKKEELSLSWREQIAGDKHSRQYILINMGVNEVMVTKVVFNKKNNNDECVLIPAADPNLGFKVLINQRLLEQFETGMKKVAHLKLDTGEESLLGNHYQCKQIIYLDVYTDTNVYEWKITE